MTSFNTYPLPTDIPSVKLEGPAYHAVPEFPLAVWVKSKKKPETIKRKFSEYIMDAMEELGMAPYDSTSDEGWADTQRQPLSPTAQSLYDAIERDRRAREKREPLIQISIGSRGHGKTKSTLDKMRYWSDQLNNHINNKELESLPAPLDCFFDLELTNYDIHNDDRPLNVFSLDHYSLVGARVLGAFGDYKPAIRQVKRLGATVKKIEVFSSRQCPHPALIIHETFSKDGSIQGQPRPGQNGVVDFDHQFLLTDRTEVIVTVQPNEKLRIRFFK